MARDKNTVVTSIYPDAVKIRGLNREISAVKMEPEIEFGAHNVIFFKALTAEVGAEAGVRSHLDDNGKIKYSTLGLSDEAVIELYMCLAHYVKRIINNQTK